MAWNSLSLRITLGLLISGALFAADSKTPAFLASYCTGCHGGAVQMADRRFDRLKLPPPDFDSVLLLQDILDRLNLGTMPPRTAKQPPAAEKMRFIESVTRVVAEANAKRASTGAHSVLRRLNRREYLNTVGDLFGINMIMFDPTDRFPRDQIVDHMDNIGDTLRTSGYLLEQYLGAADRVVEKALKQQERPQQQNWVFNSKFRQQPSIDGTHRAVFQQKNLALYTALNTIIEGAYGPIYEFAQGVPADGYYEITFKAEAFNRRNPYDSAKWGMDQDAPFRVGVVPGNIKVSLLHHAQPIEPRLGEVTLGDNGPEWHTLKVWMDAGYTPRFTFPNGLAMNDSRDAAQQIARSLPAELRKERKVDPGNRAASFVNPLIAALTFGKMPHVRIYEVRITGPFVETWPPESHRLLFGSQPFEPSRTREILERFATRAYRRPVRKPELDSLMAVAEGRIQKGKTPFEALKTALKSALCSPAFLYLEESNQGAVLEPYALASRLSYFLWSTMPDGELFKLAGSGELKKPAVLQAQMRRMLADPKSRAFVEGFLDSWLNLRAIGDMPPDRDAFERYYMQDLRVAMRTETQMFTRYLLDHNQSIVNFLDSKFTFLNKPLAKLYGMDSAIDSVGGQNFRKVEITEPNRGGLLGMASILTVSANGIETSPVTRGVWILENIFGTPPAPPPDNVKPIDPDLRGAHSIREILVKHRGSETCMSCHAKIDPPGFSLENFDPIGAWRAKYKNGAVIDASGEVGGESFEDIAGFKKLLVKRKSDFARVLTERLLTYACGRRVEKLDRPRVDRIVRQLGDRGYGFRDLVELAVSSEMFQAK